MSRSRVRFPSEAPIGVRVPAVSATPFPQVTTGEYTGCGSRCCRLFAQPSAPVLALVLLGESMQVIALSFPGVQRTVVESMGFTESW